MVKYNRSLHKIFIDLKNRNFNNKNLLLIYLKIKILKILFKINFNNNKDGLVHQMMNNRVNKVL